jgi:hypothetical protein
VQELFVFLFFFFHCVNTITFQNKIHPTRSRWTSLVILYSRAQTTTTTDRVRNNRATIESL